ncbi:phage repressor [Mergibacter septicus]|uniref:Phage repressor n=1 Tax=Mergibacter septicus TaxID=221402 RepID=A0A8D4IZR3_9PAST|nr:helix-turn-helix transcriptional regulator [Mergibacter septicus]AWX15584.1 phage repressor [Mergibacter septicus]QDJ14838.1 phage repressor [Mergibacter septicus]UTU47734.1 helix-turn-helix transcriptional regulator [Mergibacter septicus]WMR96660.1 helix-turn-helix transcriptional regulator [Mergibacter septicus]
MPNLSTRLQKLLLKKNVSQSWLAQKVNVSQQSIQKILTGETRNPKYILEIAAALDVDPNWLKTGEGDIPNFANSYETQAEIQDKAIKIDLLDISASAGNGTFVSSDVIEVVSSIEYTQDFFTKTFHKKEAQNIKLINVKGDSMSPTLECGDLIFVDISIQKYDGDGIYIFSYGETLFVKRLQMAGDKLFVLSDNKSYEKWDITEKNFYKFRVQGKVLIGQSQQLQRFG